jgi:hypothetical protein
LAIIQHLAYNFLDLNEEMAHVEVLAVEIKQFQGTGRRG